MNRIFLAAAFALFGPSAVFAQDVYFTPPDVAPLLINPAFTGAFNGNLRVTAAYQSIDPNTSTNVSVDLPVYTGSKGSYFAAGVQVFRYDMPDMVVQSMVVASAAYHRLFRIASTEKNFDLAIGVQYGQLRTKFDAGYLNLISSYSGYPASFSEDVIFKSNVVNAGINISHAVCKRFSYTLGYSRYYINEPESRKDDLSQKILAVQNIAAGINWAVGRKLSLHPGLVYQKQEYFRRQLAMGNEFRYAIGSDSSHHLFTNVFLNIWYRDGEMYTAMAGVGSGKVRLGIGVYHTVTAAGINGLLLQARFIAPRKSSAVRKRIIPCDRF